MSNDVILTCPRFLYVKKGCKIIYRGNIFIGVYCYYYIKAETFIFTATTTKEPEVVIATHTIILGVVGGVIFTAVALGVLITCLQKHREEKRRTHALRQEERHGNKVEAATLLHGACPNQAIPMEKYPPQHGNTNGQLNHTGAAANHYPGRHPDQFTRIPPYEPHYQPVSGYSGTPRRASEHDILAGPSTQPSPRLQRPSSRSEQDFLRASSLKRNPPQAAASGSASYRRDLRRQHSDERPLRRSGSSRSPSPRDRTPSPRPDVVQEAKFVYPRGQQPGIGFEGVTRDLGYTYGADVWKPQSQTDSGSGGSLRPRESPRRQVPDQSPRILRNKSVPPPSSPAYYTQDRPYSKPTQDPRRNPPTPPRRQTPVASRYDTGPSIPRPPSPPDIGAHYNPKTYPTTTRYAEPRPQYKEATVRFDDPRGDGGSLGRRTILGTRTAQI